MKNIKTKITYFIASFVFAAAIMTVPSHTVSADTYPAGSDVMVMVNLDNGLTYQKNDPFTVTGAITPISGTIETVDMNVIAGGIAGTIFTPQPTAYQIYKTMLLPGATANAGTFNANFSVGVEEDEAPTFCYMRLRAQFVAFRWGRFFLEKWNGTTYVPFASTGNINRLEFDYQLQNNPESVNYQGPGNIPVNSDWSDTITNVSTGNTNNFTNGTGQVKEIAGTDGHTGIRFVEIRAMGSNSQSNFTLPGNCGMGYQ